MAKKIAAKTAGAKTNTAKKGKAEEVKAKKAASGKKPEKKDTSGKGAVKKEQEVKVAKNTATVKPAAAERKPAPKKAEAKDTKKPAPKPVKRPEAPVKNSAAKKPVVAKKPSSSKKPAKERASDDEEELDELEVPAPEEKDAVDLDEELDPALVGEIAADEPVDDVDVDADEEILPGVDLELEIDADAEVFGDKKEAPLLARKVTTGKKPKIIVIASTGPKKLLKLAPGLLLNVQKPPLSSGVPVCSESDNKREYRKLTKKEIAQIKEKLIVMREDILEKMRKELADTRQRAGTAPADLIDQASDAYDDDVSFEIASANDEDLEQIEAALERLAEGTYGLCEICNVPISPARLKILPFATRCVSCRGDYEKTRARKDAGAWNFFGEGENGDSEEGREEEEE